MEEVIAFWSSTRAIMLYYGPNIEVVQASSTPDSGAILYRDTTGIVPYIYYHEYQLLPGGTAVVGVEL